MSLEQIEQMVRAANPVPDVAILGESVSHRGHTGASTPDPGGGPGPVLRPLNGEQFGDIDEREAYTTSPDDLAGARHRGRRWMLVAATTIVVLGLGLAVTAVRDPDGVRTDTVAPTPTPGTNPTTTSLLPGAPLLPPGIFVGVWLSTDTDGSSQTMEIEGGDDGSAQMTLHDTAATALCSSAAASVIGTGARESRGDLVVTITGLSCADGSEPRLSAPIESGYTFTYHRQSDTLTDNSGVVWRREGSEGADDPSGAPPTSGGMWPQSSVDELPEAQELAESGDPAYTWQVDPLLSSDEWWGHLRQPGAEIVERFLREELGWDHALFNPYQGDDGDGAADGVIRGVVYLRCAPGETNQLYPTAPDGHQEAPGAEGCAPTIDELHYETVSLDLSQPDRRGPAGIWVVSRWAMTAPFAQTDPNVAEVEVTARLDEFLAARVAGEGADGYVNVGGETFAMLEEVPLLYATTSGARYERYEIERVSGPYWPFGEMEFKVRLFAEGGETVVEQLISSNAGGPLGLWSGVTDTTENGQPVTVPYGFFEGEVTASAPNPWKVSPLFAVALTLDSQSGDERIEMIGDPFPVATGCEQGPAAAGTDALARSIQSDPDLEASAPVSVVVGGSAGVQMDVALAPGASVCEVIPSTQVLTQDDGHTGPGPPGLNLDQGSRMRLYLLDLPEGLATRILAIAVVAPEGRFEAVLEAATPIIESIEFHTD